MFSFPDDASAVHDEDVVCLFHRRDAMGDDESRLSAPVVADVRKNLLLRVGIHSREGIVEDEDGRILVDRAGDRKSLPLAAGDGRSLSPMIVS